MNHFVLFPEFEFFDSPFIRRESQKSDKIKEVEEEIKTNKIKLDKVNQVIEDYQNKSKVLSVKLNELQEKLETLKKQAKNEVDSRAGYNEFVQKYISKFGNDHLINLFIHTYNNLINNDHVHIQIDKLNENNFNIQIETHTPTDLESQNSKLLYQLFKTIQTNMN